MIFSTVTVVLISLVIYLLYKSSRVPKGNENYWRIFYLQSFILDFPPGPGRLPIVGSLLSIPQVNGVLVAGTQWFIKRYGKLVINLFVLLFDLIL